MKDTAHRERIGKRIAEIRKKKGLTILQLHEMTGLDNSNIGKIERGRYNVSIDILQKICDALDVKLNIVDNTIIDIDKACEWLKEEISNYVSYDGEIDKELIDDFKKAMIKAAD